MELELLPKFSDKNKIMHLADVNIGSQFFSSGGNAGGLFGRSNLQGIGYLVTLFLRGAFMLASLILLYYFILGGIGMMSSAGKSDPKAAEQAKATLTTALIGFIVVLMAYSIVKLVGTLLGIPGGII